MGAGQQKIVRLTGRRRVIARRLQRRVCQTCAAAAGTGKDPENESLECPPMELGQESRDAQAASLRAEGVRKTATETRTRLAMMRFSSLTARQDAERVREKSLAVEKPAACSNKGLGLRSGTLRNRVHALRRYCT